MNLGRHKATILENHFGKTAKGKEYIELKLEVDGTKISTAIWMTKAAENIAKAQLRSIGFDPATESLLPIFENKEHFKGKMIDVDIEEEEYMGKTQIKARIVTSKVSKKRILQMDQMFKGGDEDDGDIPF